MIVDPDCQICQNPERMELDQTVRETGQRAAARKYGVSRQSIQRHIQKGHADDGEDPKTKPKVEVPLQEKPAVKRAIGTMRDCKNRKRYLVHLLHTGTFEGVPTLQRLSECWPDVTMRGLAELVAQAAMETDFFRGTQQTKRLVALAKARKIERKAMRGKDLKTALRALELQTKIERITAEPDLAAALTASQAWTLVAQVLQRKNPELLDEIHATLAAEEARKRQALTPATVDGESGS